VKYTLFLQGEVNDEMVAKVQKKLGKIDDIEAVDVLLSSPGGDPHCALAISSLFRLSPAYITVHAIGNVASAAVLILAYGDKRLMAKESWVMVHEDSAELSGEVKDLERESRYLRRMENQWTALLASVTKTTAEDWTKLHKATTYLSAAECLKLGLIDEVV